MQADHLFHVNLIYSPLFQITRHTLAAFAVQASNAKFLESQGFGKPRAETSENPVFKTYGVQGQVTGLSQAVGHPRTFEWPLLYEQS
jgi:hypothetical protein